MELTENFNRMFQAVSDVELRQNPRLKKKILKLRSLLKIFEKNEKRAERIEAGNEAKPKPVHEV